MKSPPVKNHWIEQAIEIHRFHIHQLKTEPHWTLQMTAASLNRSIGSVSQSILISSWLKTHEKQLRRFKSMKDALEFVREKKKEIQLAEVDL